MIDVAKLDVSYCKGDGYGGRRKEAEFHHTYFYKDRLLNSLSSSEISSSHSSWIRRWQPSGI